MKLLLLLLVLSSTASAKTIYLKSDPWCPYACESKDKNQGIVVDIARAIFKKHNIDIDYANVNYARALKETRAGLNDGVVGCAREDAPDFIFPTMPQSEAIYQYFSLKDSNFIYKNLESIKNKKIGAINSYTYDVETTDQIQKNNPSFVVVSGDLGLGQLIKMLELKRVDAIVESGAVFSTYLQDNKLDAQKFKMVGSPKQIPQKIYVCFSPKLAQAKTYAKMIDDGMKELTKSGELKKIIEKYNIKNWQ